MIWISFTEKFMDKNFDFILQHSFKYIFSENNVHTDKIIMIFLNKISINYRDAVRISRPAVVSTTYKSLIYTSHESVDIIGIL